MSGAKEQLYLYKIEIDLDDEQLALVVVAESDEKAFDYIEGHVVRHFVHNPPLKQAAITEKKRLGKGEGYIFEVKA